MRQNNAYKLMRGLIEAAGLSADWFERSVNETKENYTDLAHNAAHVYMHAYRSSGDTSNLEMAIRLYSKAFQPAEERNANDYVYLHSLARALRIRYKLYGDTKDAKRAAELQSKALSIVEPMNTDYVEVLCGAAQTHLMTGSEFFDLDQAAKYLSEALLNTRCSARRRLSEAAEVLETYELVAATVDLTPKLRASLINVYWLAMSLLPQVANLSLDPRSLLRVLESGENLGTTAALHALLLVETGHAVGMLEASRGVFWTQQLRLRAPFNSLPSDLRDELVASSQQLELMRLSSGSEEIIKNVEGAGPEARSTIEHRLSMRIEDLLTQARALPGFERLLLHDPFSTLAMAALDGPVLILLSGATSAHGILIRSPKSSAEQISLPTLDLERLEYLCHSLMRAARFSRGLTRDRGLKLAPATSHNNNARAVVAELWTKVMQPIVNALGYTKAIGRQRPRLWICSTGPFVHLPVHAAGLYGKENQHYLSQYYVSSYTPTLGALIRARTKSIPLERSRAKVLLAAVFKPYKWAPLPYAKREAESIRSILPLETVLHSSLKPTADTCASVEDVLGHVASASILHLACHGHQDHDNPLESGFVMQDSMLTVSRLMALNLPNAFLAFLSACETARGDAKQPNQAVNLASTMMFAGFKSVIATMWAMGDVDGPIVATKVYEELFRGNAEILDTDTIPYALDDAMHNLRERQGVHVVRWATYAHLGV